MLSGISGVSSYYNMYRYSGYGQTNPYIRSAQIQGARQASGVVATGTVTPVSRTHPSGPVQPVQPVPAVASVTPGTQGNEFSGIFIRKGVDPVEFAVRMRIRYEEDPTSDGRQGETGTGEVTGPGSAQKAAQEGKCQTCEQRKYQDGSDDMGVSFQTPTRIAPENVASAVRGHEREHVFREQARARRENRRVVSQSVALHTSVCPECGKVYISGGTTTTTTAASKESAPQQEQPQRRPFSAVA